MHRANIEGSIISMSALGKLKLIMGIMFMKIFTGVVMSALMLGLLACSDREPSADAAEVEKPSGVIPERHLKALDRAKEVEGLMQKSEQDLRAKIDADS